jgi:hypothetical protein
MHYAEIADLRPIVTNDPDEPVFVVSVYQPLGDPHPYRERSWSVSGADAPEVLEWAARRAQGDPWVVRVAAAEYEAPYLIRLAGIDPTRGGEASDRYEAVSDVVPTLEELGRRAQDRQG